MFHPLIYSPQPSIHPSPDIIIYLLFRSSCPRINVNILLWFHPNYPFNVRMGTTNRYEGLAWLTGSVITDQEHPLTHIVISINVILLDGHTYKRTCHPSPVHLLLHNGSCTFPHRLLLLYSYCHWSIRGACVFMGKGQGIRTKATKWNCSNPL